LALYLSQNLVWILVRETPALKARKGAKMRPRRRYRVTLIELMIVVASSGSAAIAIDFIGMQRGRRL